MLIQRLLWIAIIAVGTFITGCTTIQINSGKPLGRAPIDYDGRWHHAFFLGTVEPFGPYRLDQICPEGWARVETYTDFGNWIVESITFGIYNPQRVTVICASVHTPKNNTHNASPTPSPPL